jgi:serine/threonine-protein kinase
MGAAEITPSFEARRKLAGTRLGNYQVGVRLGAGGSAAVYLARPAALGDDRLVALKVVHEHLAEERDFINQFLDEANLLVRLSHPGIVRVFELGQDGDTLFLAMEYLHGQTLASMYHALVRRGERLSPVEVAWIGAAVARGLHYAHELRDEAGNPLGLVHRDVSPQNVFLTYDGEVKLIDFGIARAAGRLAQTTLGRIKGKFSYMAPEQALGREFDRRADLFALGATLYEAAVGARLFAGDETETLHKLLLEDVPDPRSKVPDFPEALAAVLKRTLASDPNQRPPDGEQLATELEAAVAFAGVDPRQSIIEKLDRFFGEKRAEQVRAVQSLRTEIPVELTLGGRDSRTTARPPSRGRKALIAGIMAFLALAVGALAFALTRKPAEATPVAVPHSIEVSIEVTTQPPVEATISIGGERSRGKSARVTRPRNSGLVEVYVTADGYESGKVTVSTERDQSVVVPLVKLPVAPPPVSASTTPKVTPVGTGKKKDPLVTKYPFGKKK